MIDLLREEIIANFGGENRDIFFSGKYILHCSPIFKKVFIDSIIKQSYTIPTTPPIQPTDVVEITEIVTPSIGRIVILKDMTQGYRIEKVENK